MMRRERGERWIKYYSSSHNILLVGEGDFSFSLCLGLTFGSATNIVATTLDSYEGLINKYQSALANLAMLEILGTSVLHGVDATQITSHRDLRYKKFHRIIFNFPHAGFYSREDDPIMISMHRDLVRRFLLNASYMLCIDGEVHVSHKTTAPFDCWRIQDLGSECSLVCIGQDEFRIEDYPGYNNKRGSGERADQPFPLRSCETYRFRLGCAAVRDLIMRKEDMMARMLPTRPPLMQHQPPSRHLANYDERAELQNYYASECRRIFEIYLNHMDHTFKNTSYDVRRSVMEVLRYGYEMYMRNAAAMRPWSDFTRILEELLNLSVLRSEKIRQLEAAVWIPWREFISIAGEYAHLDVLRSERLRQLVSYSIVSSPPHWLADALALLE